MRHKTFISYHHGNDQYYRNQFENKFSNLNDIMVSKSVQDGDISSLLKTETVRQKIRDDYLRDSTVTVVLIGSQTWQRKHVDWEIGSSIRETRYNSRSGLLGIFLPTYRFLNNRGEYNPHTIPPRLYKNVINGYAKLYRWSDSSYEVQSQIDEAFKNRKLVIPDNSYPHFVNNRTGWQWQ